MTKSAVIICPGRGTYNATELGYLARHHSNQTSVLASFDAYRDTQQQDTISMLDGADRFSIAKHTRGDAASPLIYASSLFDAQAIRDEFDVVAVTGNSMGWYTALAVSGAVSPIGGFEIVNTMGTLMQERLIGGQTIYPFVDENWVEIPGERDKLLALIHAIDARSDQILDVSIHLGGMLVVSGNEAGITAFENSVTRLQGRYPMRLPNHAAFHTKLQEPIAQEGRKRLGADLFQSAQTALVDGRGAVWHPKTYSSQELKSYTLGTQVVEAYDFTKAVQVAAKTFAPDVFIIAGPGTTLGGAVAQSLIDIGWSGMHDKAEFQSQQSKTPILISMGREDQRRLVV
ncbi:MAG: ACP S-malonyltransferase [Litoreibacter sp.]